MENSQEGKINLPTDICNLALDCIGADITLSDVEDGTSNAQICLRAYRECLTSLLRAAPWQFARKQLPMELLADATGQTPNVGTTVIPPWVYEYAYPNDCVAVRFVPASPVVANQVPPGNIAINTQVPVSPGLGITTLIGQRLRPTRFLIARDVNYPPQAQQLWWEIRGMSPAGRSVVLTNTPQATVVYTSLVLYPSEWDDSFRAAMIAYIAQAICMGIHKKNLPLARQLRDDQIAITKRVIQAARIADGNEMFATTDHIPDWVQARRSGGPFPYGGEDDSAFGMLYAPWSPAGFSNGSAF